MQEGGRQRHLRFRPSERAGQRVDAADAEGDPTEQDRQAACLRLRDSLKVDRRFLLFGFGEFKEFDTENSIQFFTLIVAYLLSRPLTSRLPLAYFSPPPQKVERVHHGLSGRRGIIRRYSSVLFQRDPRPVRHEAVRGHRSGHQTIETSHPRRERWASSQ